MDPMRRLVRADGCRMAFTPTDALVYGGECLTVAFSDPTKLSTGGAWYFVFEGSKQRHVTTGRKVNATTLQAVVPAHRDAETVRLSILSSSPAVPAAPGAPPTQLGSTTFRYYSDSAHLLALFLLDAVYDDQGDSEEDGGGGGGGGRLLERPEEIRGDGFALLAEELETLDRRLMRALLHVEVPDNWHILGHHGTMAEPPPRESLLHFAARWGLQQVTEVLMAQAGSLDALGLPNRQGLLPLDIAQQDHNQKLVDTLLGRSYYDSGGPQWLEKKRRQQAPTIIRQHDQGLATVTNNLGKSTKTLEDDLALLQDMTSLMLQQQQQSSSSSAPQLPPRRPRHHRASAPPAAPSASSSTAAATKSQYMWPAKTRRAHSDGVIREEPEYDDELTIPVHRSNSASPSYNSQQQHHHYHHHHHHQQHQQQHQQQDAEQELNVPVHRSNSASPSVSYHQQQQQQQEQEQYNNENSDDSLQQQPHQQQQHRYRRHRMHRQDSYHSRRHYKRSSPQSSAATVPPGRTQSTGSLPSATRSETGALPGGAVTVVDDYDQPQRHWDISSNSAVSIDPSLPSSSSSYVLSNSSSAPALPHKEYYNKQQPPGAGARKSKKAAPLPPTGLGADVVRSGPAPQPKPGVLEENLRRLHEIHEGIHKLRESNTQQQQDENARLRQDSLARFSTSCPSLADQILKPSNQPAANPGGASTRSTLAATTAANQYADHYQSMVELGGHAGRGSLDATMLDCMSTNFRNTPVTPAAEDTADNIQHNNKLAFPQLCPSSVQICINDVTVDASDDYGLVARRTSDGSQEAGADPGGRGGGIGGAWDGLEGGGSTLDPEMRMIDELKKSHRRSSWCPEEGRKKEDRHEKQRMMLAVSGRSQSLSSLDGNDEDSDTDEGSLGSYKSRDENTEKTGANKRHLSAAPHTTASVSDLANMEDVDNYDLDLDSSYHGDEECDSPVHTTAAEAATFRQQERLGSSPVRPVGEVPNRSTPNFQVSGVEHGGTGSAGDTGGGGGSTAGTDSLVAMDTTGTASGGGGLQPPNLMKSVSTPSIATETKGHDIRQGSTSDADASEGPGTPRDGSPPCSIRRLLAEHDAQVAKQSAGEEDEDVELADASGVVSDKPRRSMIEFLQPATAQPTTANKQSLEEERKKREPKEEKKRRSSVFSKFGSYRQKKAAKDNKLIRNTHEFVSVSFSNSTSCDVCNRFMANKPALQCENCMVNVHENTCKDQIAPCTRLKSSSSPRMPKYQSASLPEGHGAAAAAGQNPGNAASGGTLSGQGGASVNLKGSQSFKGEYKRATSVPSTRPSLQVSQSGSNLLPRSSSPSKVISEEREKESPSGGSEENCATPPPPKTPPVNNHMLTESSIADTLSVSIESLDEVTNDVAELSDDPDLSVPTEVEPEAWSVTVDKKTLKKMSAKDIKRQDHIWEFIQTEKSHCRTLKIMQKVFAAGMMKECNIPAGNVERVFPRLSDLLDIHLYFLHTLLERQRTRPDKSIDVIGDVLLAQFQGDMGMKMKVAYGDFCSRHNESVQLYKDLHKSDRKFQAFIKKCNRNNVCKRLGVPECILLVTQRMTKYPLLLESIIKATKDNKCEREALTVSLGLTKDILSYVDLQVDAHEKEQKLFEIYNKLDARQSTFFKGKKFKKSDLLMNSRKLLHEGSIKWMSARGKPCEVIAVILSDLMFFLVESNQKYSFFTQDNKSSVISMSKLLVREKGDTRDTKGIYLICQSKTEPEMYELVCRSPDDRKAWVRIVRDAVHRCPEEDEGVPSESEEERKLLEARAAKMRQIIDALHKKDSAIQSCCEDKMKMVTDMQELFCKEGETPPPLKSVYKDEEEQELLDPDVLVQEATNEATRLLSLVSTLVAPPVLLPATSLYRSATSVGEHEYHGPAGPLPKRAETFSGFDGKEKDKSSVIKRRYPSSIQQELENSRCNSLHDLVESDSGVSLETPPGSNDRKSNLQRRQSVAVVKLEETNKVNKERLSRRTSTSFLQNLLTTKQQQQQQQQQLSTGEASGQSTGDSPAGSNTDLSVLPSMREQCNCAAQLLSYVHSLVAVTAQQSSEVERFRGMLQEANSKVSMLYSEGHSKSSSFHHDRQLEELRNLQEQVRSERDELSARKASEHAALELHHESIRAEQDRLEAERAELRQQREDLNRHKETLQKQMELFEQQRRSQSPAPTSLLDSVSHKRSASDDIQQQNYSIGVGGGGGSQGRAAGEAVAAVISGHKRDSSKSRSHSVSSSGRKDSTATMPLHLLSATNEQKLVLSSNAAAAAGTGQATNQGAVHSSPPSFSQMLPHKLSVSSSSGSPGLPPKHQRGASAGVSGPLSPPQGPRLMHAKSQPALNVGGGRLLGGPRTPGTGAPTNVLPMKLAEAGNKQRPKSAGAPSATGNPPTSSNKKTHEIIYF